MQSPLEIERKWLVDGWPKNDFPILKEEFMRQGYLVVEPTVRIREEKKSSSEESVYMLCFKKNVDGLTRKETEFPIQKEQFEELEDLIGLPLIPKVRRTYLLPCGEHLEVNRVDEGQPTGFSYAEIEFESEEKANAFDPSQQGLEEYLSREVTNVPGQSMGAYWQRVRLNNPSEN